MSENTERAAEANGAVGRVIKNRFELKQEIASRASCKVYLATDRELSREVAVKIFLDKPGTGNASVKLFDDETAALRKASHQVLVPIVDGGLDKDELFMVLEFIPGQNLRDKLKEKGKPFEVDEAVALISRLCEALQELHAERLDGKPLIHGHIDSRAVLFKGDDPRLAGYHPVAIDQLQKQMTSVARVAADAGYISPEQLTGTDQLDGRTDVYALGVLLFELLCAERPFVAANPLQAAMLRMTASPPAPSKKNPAITPLLEASILKALARDPKERFQSALEFRDALQANKKGSKNPFLEVAGAAGAPAAAAATTGDRMTTETLAVSFSTSDIQAMLRGGAAAKGQPAGGVSAGKIAPDDSSRTMMGVSTQSMLRPALVRMSGPKRGERILLEKSQMLIGSDSSCDLCFSGKEISARHAIIVEKDGGYVICALSQRGVDVGDVHLKVEEEKKLEKGDVLSLGDNELRFLAPGEVFTLKDDGVSHVAAKPRGKGARYLLIAALFLAAAGLGGIYIWKGNIDTAKENANRQEATLSKKRDDAVRKLLGEGDELLKKGQLSEPIGDNALEKFQSVLTLDPDNGYAKRRLDEIADRQRQLTIEAERRRQMASKLNELMAQGELYLSENQLVSPPGRNAKESFQEVLKLDPTNAKAREKISQIDRLLGDMLGRLKGMLDKAKDLVSRGQFVEPEGDNALEVIKEIRKVDADNRDATDLVYRMAARSLLSGDKAKETKQVREIRRNYLTAQALGVDPACIEVKMKGLDLIAKSAGTVVLSNNNTECPKSGPGYLDSSELSKRISSMKLEDELKGR